MQIQMLLQKDINNEGTDYYSPLENILAEELGGVAYDFTSYRLVAKFDGNEIGFAQFNIFGEILWLDTIYVEDSSREQGVGRALMNDIKECAVSHSCAEIQLNTYFHKAKSFFSECGFELVTSIDHWKYGLTCNLMKLKLAVD